MAVDSSQMYRWLYQLAHTLHAQQGNTRAILATALLLTRDALNVQHGCIILLDEDTSIKDALLTDETVSGAVQGLWNWMSARMQHRRKHILIPDLSMELPFPREATDGSKLTGGSAAAVPLMWGKRLHGVLMFMHTYTDHFDAPSIDMLEQIAATTATALETAERFERTTEAEAHYRMVFEDSAAATCVTDLGGRLLQINNAAAHVFGYTAESLQGVALTALCDIHRDTVIALGQSEVGCETIVLIQAQNALGQIVALRAGGRRVNSGIYDCIIWTLEDITTQKEQEAAQRDLAAMTYHDVRGLLQNVDGSLGRLDRLVQGDQHPAFYQLMDIASRSTRQLTRMMSTLLDEERLEAGHATLDRRPTVLPVLLADAVDMLYFKTDNADQELKFDVEEDLPLVMMDAEMILRVVTNLIENAVKYTPAGGSITISARTSGNAVRVAIQDTGPGIPDHLREQIFDKYVRVKHKNTPGVGLGLAFCRMAVEAHDGRIWVENGPTGKGAAFCFLLPTEANTEQVKV